MSDAGLQRELFDLYFAQAETFLTAMRACLDSDDEAAWRAAAHGVKGTANTLGLLRLGESAAAAEASAPSALRLEDLRDDYVAALATAYAHASETS